MNGKSFTCIVCPTGCCLTVRKEGSEWIVEGNSCPRGKDYAISEMTDPKRTVTAVVRTDSKSWPYAPVRTDKPLPRALIKPLLKELYAYEAKTSFKRGQALLRDFAGSGVEAIFTMDCEK